MNEQKFFRCKHCGNIVGMIHDANIPMVCCEEVMQELIPNTTDGATEKHLPVISVKERLIHIKVGSVAHPMTEEHHIEFIYLQTEQGGQMKRLSVNTEADVIFAVLNDTPYAVYAYCNLHGLWKSSVCAEDTTTKQHESDEKACSPEFAEGCK